MSKGLKYDQGKPDLSLIPYSALIEEAKGFMLGESKYGRYNFTKGMDSNRLVAAALRHIYDWNQGTDLDAESRANHLGHARCCLAMILECARLGTLQDNRHHVHMAEEDMAQNAALKRQEELANFFAELALDADTAESEHTRILDYVK